MPFGNLEAGIWPAGFPPLLSWCVLVSAAAGSAANSPAAITAAAARLAVRSFRVPFKIYSSFKVNIINYHHTTTA